MSIARCECDRLVDTDEDCMGEWCSECLTYVCERCLEHDEDYTAEIDAGDIQTSYLCQTCRDKKETEITV